MLKLVMLIESGKGVVEKILLDTVRSMIVLTKVQNLAT
jgi:hypothetical protein